MKKIKILLVGSVLLLILILPGCIARKSAGMQNLSAIKFLAVYELPHALQFQGTTVGGLSGIDYDAKRKQYYVISDDRSALNPARFYTLEIPISQNKIDTVIFTSVVNLKQENGMVYPSSKTNPALTPDPESIRYDAKRDVLIWTSEGERIVKKGQLVLEDPSVTMMTREGKYIDTFPLPPNMHMHATENGPRQNGVFEGSTFTPGFKELFINVEEPLYEDGPRAGGKDTSGWIRLIRYDAKTHRPLDQYAYSIDPVQYPATPANAFKINGVPDILAINSKTLLITERSFSTGKTGCAIRIYKADLSKASDVSNFSLLNSGTGFIPAIKTRLFNFEDLGIYIDNVEGATWGPLLPNGHRTLIFVADDNFDATEKTQFFLFEVLP